jgi:DNA-binding NtrC family response regulator
MESIPLKTPILIVDDDAGLLLSIKATLMSAGMPEPALLSDSRKALEWVRNRRFHLILLDLNMPHLNGLVLLRQIKQEFPDIECVIVTATDEAATAVEALKFGAYDYMVKPLNSEKLMITINRALERYDLRHELALFERKQSFTDLSNPEAFGDMVAADDAMALVFRQVEVVAPTDYSVVITGESGTGKEMLARIVHRLSNRASMPFLAVNMAAFNKTVFEDEFFGHIKGAYTDAQAEKMGFFEAAHGGTLFLDEIAELETSLQSKLLRVLEERELYRLGSTQVRDVDVRIISATNQDIDARVRAGDFRADLFYRLNTYSITIPPLRRRRSDILPLARHFLKRHVSRNSKVIEDLSPDLCARLKAYSFPGNVRELENIIAAAVLLETGGVLQASSVQGLKACPPEPESQTEVLLTLDELEKRHILATLRATGGNRIKAAKILGINPTTVYRKIEKLKLSL